VFMLGLESAKEGEGWSRWIICTSSEIIAERWCRALLGLVGTAVPVAMESPPGLADTFSTKFALGDGVALFVSSCDAASSANWRMEE